VLDINMIKVVLGGETIQVKFIWQSKAASSYDLYL